MMRILAIVVAELESSEETVAMNDMPARIMIDAGNPAKWVSNRDGYNISENWSNSFLSKKVKKGFLSLTISSNPNFCS